MKAGNPFDMERRQTSSMRPSSELTRQFRGGLGEVFEQEPGGGDPPGSVAAERPVGLYARTLEVPEDMLGERVAPFLKAPVPSPYVAATAPSAGPSDLRSGWMRVLRVADARVLEVLERNTTPFSSKSRPSLSAGQDQQQDPPKFY
jgi:hypothetical protein